MRVILKTITPIFIGGGQDAVLTPVMDYIRPSRKNEIWIVNKNAFIEFLEKKNVMEDYLKAIRNADSFDLLEFMVGTLKLSPEELKLVLEKGGIRFKVEESERHFPKISRFISSRGRKYIPGSSVKGAIRTAVAYAFLNEKGAGFSKVKSKLRGRRPKRAFEDASLQFEIFSGRVSESGKYNAKDDFFKLLRVRDSEALKKNDFVVVPCYSYHIRREKKGPPIYLECLDEGREIEIDISVFKGKSLLYELPSGFWGFLKASEKDIIRKLFDFLNQFAKDFIAREIKSVSGTLLNFYTNLERKLNSCLEGGKEALILLGRGTTFFGKTVDMVWSDSEMEELRDLFKNRSMGCIENGKSKPFPITRPLWSDGGHWKPIGWASLRIE